MIDKEVEILLEESSRKTLEKEMIQDYINYMQGGVRPPQFIKTVKLVIEILKTFI